MPRPSVQNFSGKPTLYEEITDKVIAELEAGCVPWVQPWGSAGINAALGRLPHLSSHLTPGDLDRFVADRVPPLG